jgi:diguanylate cyclase (GGDEF)-like protein/PAS domain S-box-containing protein
MKAKPPEHEPVGGRELDAYGTGWRTDLAKRWTSRLGGVAYLPMSRSEVERNLLELVDLLVAALHDPERTEQAGSTVGSRLVAMHATGPASLSRTLEVLRDHLVPDSAEEPVRRVLALLASIAAGYAAADRQGVFDQQEVLKRALLQSKLRAERELDASEARFREVFVSTPVGVAICDLTGKFVEVNPALEHALGYRAQDLAAMTIHELFPPEEAQYFSSAYEELAENNGSTRLRERCRLLRFDGEPAWTHITASVLRDADGAVSHFLTTVEDISELHLLQERFQYQALHDAMTGLPNRQFFQTRLETTLASLPSDAVLTIYHLVLDGFELINDGLGYQVGDALLKSVARRLEGLIAGEEAMAARFGGTEFGILMRESSNTPQVPEFAALINDELAEPIYVGEHGIATSASIGVVRWSVSECTPDMMMRAAEVALRRAKSAGKRQWAMFDQHRAPHERTESRLASVIPGALEMGEFELTYQPMVDLADDVVVGLHTDLRWQPEGHEPFGHARCLDLAERTGVTLSLRDWMLRTIWEQSAAWRSSGSNPYLVVDLSPNQVMDPDLVAAIRGILTDGDLDAGRLWLSAPTHALVGDADEARENIEVLDSMGIRSAMREFRASPEELCWLRKLPVRAVRLAPELVQLIHTSDDDTPEAQAIARMVPLVGATGIVTAVDGISTAEQAQRWRSMGCRVGIGPLYGDPVPPAQAPRVHSTSATSPFRVGQ